MKTIMQVSLSIVLMVWSMAAIAQSASTVTKDGVKYVAYRGNSYAYVDSSPKAKGSVTILDKIDIDKRELTVISISPDAFKGNEDITAITLPNTIREIGSDAFLMCKNLKQINIPHSMQTIGAQAFRQTAFKAESNGLLYVDNWLVGCGFVEVDSPQGDGKKVVMMMEPMGDIEVKEGTVGIASNTFYQCEQITSLTLPASLTNINFPITIGCKSLSAITVHQDNTKFDSRDNCNAIINSKTRVLMAGCQATLIPNGVESIAGKAFASCTGLKSITFPSTVKSIGNLAFNNCVNLREFSIPETVTQVANASFAGTGWYKALPDGLICKDGWLLGWKGQRPSGTLVVPDGTHHIADYAFKKCNDLKKVVIPTSLQRIGWESFSYCENLKDVVIPEGVETIGSYAFYYCPNLKIINIPASVKTVSFLSFLRTAWYDNLSDGVIYLDGWLLKWKGKKPKGKLTIKNGTKHIAEGALDECKELTTVVIPSTVTSIGSGSFAHCKELVSIVIPEGVKVMGYACFDGCKKLNEIHIPASVTEVGGNILRGTSWYDAQPDNESLYLDNWLLGTKGNYEAPYKMEILPGTKGVAEYALAWSDNLSTVVIPPSVQYINKYAFRDCEKLIQVNISDLEAWKRIIFGNDESNPTNFSHCLMLNGQTITSW